MTDREKFVETAHEYLTVPYVWGGSSKEGIDCSGLVIACLTAINRWEPGADDTAQGLWNRFFRKYGESLYPKEGSLSFWFNKHGKAYHVAICIDGTQCITADGGDRSCLTPEIAIAHGAYVRIRDINHRRTRPKFVDIFPIERSVEDAGQV